MLAHFRPVFFAFMGLSLGILMTGTFYTYSKVLPAVVLAALFFYVLMLIFYKLKDRSKFVNYFWKVRNYIFVILGAFVVGVGLYHLVKVEYNVDFVPSGNTEYNISGFVDANYIKNESRIYFLINNVTVTEPNTKNTVKLKRNLYIYIKNNKIENEKLKVIAPGNFVSFRSTIELWEIFNDDGVNSFGVKKSFQHICYSSLEDMTFTEGKMSFLDSVRESLRDIYNKFLPDRYAALAYSVMVGDETALEYDMSNSFKISGIAHIIAVSGMNCAMIVGVLLFALKKFRKRYLLKFIVISVVLIFYCMLCNNAPSVVRATLMAMFLLFGNLFSKQADNLTSVSLSGILILLFSPLSIFDVSFLLSFVCVFAIFLLYPMFKDLFKKSRFPKITDAAALTITATLGSVPIMINTFGYFSTVGLIANMVLVPLFEFLFVILFSISFVALILNFVGFLIVPLQYGFFLLDKGSAILSSIDFAAISLPAIPDVFVISYFLAMFLISRFTVCNKALKLFLFGITLSFAVFGYVSILI